MKETHHVSRNHAQPLFLMLCLTLGMLIPRTNAQDEYARGLVVYKKTTNEEPAYYEGTLFKGFTDVAAWYEFNVGQQYPLRLEKGMVSKIISFEVFDDRGNQSPVFTMNIMSDEDLRQISDLQSTLNKEVKTSPKLAGVVKSIDGVLNQMKKEYQSGYLRIGGKWVLRSTYMAMQASRAATPQKTAIRNRQMGIKPVNGRLEE